jgi:hypothetical protein
MFITNTETIVIVKDREIARDPSILGHIIPRKV